MNVKILYFFLLCVFCACENVSEVDSDRNLFDEEKVQVKYQQVKENLKETDEQLDSVGKEVKNDVKSVDNSLDKKV